MRSARRYRHRSRSRSRSTSRPRSREFEKRRSSRDGSRQRSRPMNDRWKHDKFEEEEKRSKGSNYHGGYGSRTNSRNYSKKNYRRSESEEDENLDMEHDYLIDEEEEEQEYLHQNQKERDFSPGRRRKYQKPTTIIYMKGLPPDVTEAEVYNMIESLEDGFRIQAIRLGRDRVTGASRGFGFIEFPTIEDSQKFMESPAAADLRIRHHPLFTNYSNAPSPGQRFAPDGVHMDWMCNMCGAINFARRLECYQCCAPRGKDVQRVSNEPVGPSNILKVSCLDPHTSEHDLHTLFSSLVAVKEIRMVMDKFTSAPRGFAFIHFFSVADASRALHTFQGFVTERQLTPIKLCYARDRVAPLPTGAAAAAAIEAAQSMQQYASWEPTEFDEAAIELQEEAPAKRNEQETAPSQDPGAEGFVYDPNSGYYYHEASGYYYNPTTGMYYNGATQEWLVYDQEKNEYVPYVAKEVAATTVITAAQSAIEQTNCAVEEIKNAPEKEKKRTGATIGAKPQLKPENIALVLKAEQEQILNESLKKLQAEREERIETAAVAAQEKEVKEKVAPPRVKGVIRGGKYRGGLAQNSN